MSVLRILARQLPRQLQQLECVAASATATQLPNALAAQSAGLCLLAHPAAAHSQQAMRLYQHQISSGSSGSSYATPYQPQLQQFRGYSQCDCPTLGGPTPDVVVVEYDDDEVDRFIALADAIEAAFPNVIVEGNPEGPGRPGSFEVKSQAGQLLFSRLGNGGWPEHEAVVDALAAAAACEVKTAESSSV